MARYLITGVSSGIGRALTKRLISQGHHVFGVARRKSLLQSLKKELKNTHKFNYYSVNLSRPDSWDKITKHLLRTKFIPTVIIFNAAIFKKDYLGSQLDLSLTRNI